ncbi:MAG: hypothetical protein M3425_08140, partial [Actinomycetota bacterium]|nr:hypothetical protein [Actinomycetota bacterium]
MPVPLLAHEKWFVDGPSAFPTDWGFFLQPAALMAAGLAVVLAVVWRLLALRLPRPELRLLAPLSRLGPYIPRLLGIHLGVSLLALAVSNAYLAPHLRLDGIPAGGAIAIAEGALGVW